MFYKLFECLQFFKLGLVWFENQIPKTKLSATYEGILTYYVSSITLYFFGRFLTNKYLKPYLNLQYEETISRIYASLSQIVIIFYLFQGGALWGIQAFVSYCLNDMLYSLWKGPKLSKMIYGHHIVGILISMIGLHTISMFSHESPHYINCRKVTIFLLCMEMSAPLLSVYWILKHEPNLHKYKDAILTLTQPILLFTYVLFRLIVPEYLFFRILTFPWVTFGFQYFLVVFFLLALQCMQIYWFVKLLKIKN